MFNVSNYSPPPSVSSASRYDHLTPQALLDVVRQTFNDCIEDNCIQNIFKYLDERNIPYSQISSSDFALWIRGVAINEKPEVFKWFLVRAAALLFIAIDRKIINYDFFSKHNLTAFLPDVKHRQIFFRACLILECSKTLEHHEFFNVATIGSYHKLFAIKKDLSRTFLSNIDRAFAEFHDHYFQLCFLNYETEKKLEKAASDIFRLVPLEFDKQIILRAVHFTKRFERTVKETEVSKKITPILKGRIIDLNTDSADEPSQSSKLNHGRGVLSAAAPASDYNDDAPHFHYKAPKESPRQSSNHSSSVVKDAERLAHIEKLREEQEQLHIEAAIAESLSSIPAEITTSQKMLAQVFAIVEECHTAGRFQDLVAYCICRGVCFDLIDRSDFIKEINAFIASKNEGQLKQFIILFAPVFMNLLERDFLTEEFLLSNYLKGKEEKHRITFLQACLIVDNRNTIKLIDFFGVNTLGTYKDLKSVYHQLKGFYPASQKNITNSFLKISELYRESTELSLKAKIQDYYTSKNYELLSCFINKELINNFMPLELEGAVIEENTSIVPAQPIITALASTPLYSSADKRK